MGEARAILVTGAASGLGRHLVQRLAAQGHLVWATDRSTEALLAAASADGWPPDRVVTGPLDVRFSPSWEGALDALEARLGPLDAVLHVAGVIRPHRVLALTDEEIDLQLDTNLKGAMLCVRAAARRMAPRGCGHIVLVNSLTGLAPTPGMTVYGATKFGARGFALGAAQELSPLGVALTVVYPDGMDTPMGRFEAGFEECALTFSGRLLPVSEVGTAVLEALERRPLEVLVPRGRGLISRLAGLFPTLAARATPRLIRRGLSRQPRYRPAR